MSQLPFLSPQISELPLRQGIALVGLPRTGKTTLGQALAQTLHWPFVDSDHALSAQLKCAVPEYIQAQGIDAFREQEKQWLTTLCNTQATGFQVLSTGGGLPCHHQLMALLKQHFVTVYLPLTQKVWLERLQQPPHELSQRLSHTELQTLFQARHPIYAQAHFTLTSRHSVEADVEKLISIVTK